MSSLAPIAESQNISKITDTILGFCNQPDPQIGVDIAAAFREAMTHTHEAEAQSAPHKLIPTVGLKDMKFIPSSAQVQRIYIVRHGESVLNVPNEHGVQLVSGQSNHAPLNAKGIKQAERLGEVLAERIPADANVVICSSTAERAKKTAHCIYEAVSKKLTTCERGDTHAGLCELSKGKYEGQPKKLEAEDVKKWEHLSAADKYRTPIVDTGESYSDTVQRSLEGLQTLAEKYAGKTLIVVAHGRIFQGFYMQWTGTIATLSSKVEPLPAPTPKNCDMLVSEVRQGNKVVQASPYAHVQFAS